MSMELQAVKCEVLTAWMRELVSHSDGAEHVYKSSRDVMEETRDTILLEAKDVFEFMHAKGCCLVDRGGTMKWRIAIREMALR